MKDLMRYLLAIALIATPVRSAQATQALTASLPLALHIGSAGLGIAAGIKVGMEATKVVVASNAIALRTFMSSTDIIAKICHWDKLKIDHWDKLSQKLFLLAIPVSGTAIDCAFTYQLATGCDALFKVILNGNAANQYPMLTASALTAIDWAKSPLMAACMARCIFRALVSFAIYNSKLESIDPTGDDGSSEDVPS